MLSGTLCHVALVHTDVSENIASIFRVPWGDRIPQLCYHGINCLSASPKRETMYGRRTLSSGMLSWRNQLYMPSGTSYCVAIVQTDVSENIASIFRVPCGDRIPQLCYHGITVYQPLQRGKLWLKNTVFWDAFMAVSIIDACACFSKKSRLILI
jgi:hypothetical protein